MPQASIPSNKHPRRVWWLIGLLVFALSATLQMPAAWVVEKYAPESPYIQHVSGNLRQGSAIWQSSASEVALTGAVQWT